jgi:UDP-N-acetylmuramoyl-tripeptide--D-alanyl-D-alanine ligase
MATIFVWIIALIWAGGTAWRIYKQARFYQIEEYKSPRYVRWLLKERERLLPSRPIAVFALSIIATIFTDNIPSDFAVVPYFVGILNAIVAIIPTAEAPIKKKFVKTPRAMRIIGTACATMAVVILVGVGIIGSLNLESDRIQAIATSALGVVMFLLAPLWLMIGNVLMIPVEEFFRQRFTTKAKRTLAVVHPKVIGITGSYGKTTTKHFLKEILSGRYQTYATPKSYNTVMGICIAINNDMANDYSIEYFICEMGAYIRGEIQRICKLTPPDISIVVEVGPQHLERFGSLENIEIAKYEIVKALKPNGVGVFNWDNPYVQNMYDKGYPQTRLTVSKTVDPSTVKDAVPRFVATEISESLNGLTFRVTDTLTQKNEVFTTSVIGEHNVTNILLATAVAIHEGMTLKEVALRVRTLQPAESRLVSKVNEKGVAVINDAYSANPVGVVSSLRVLGMHTQGKRVLITPGMIELGDLHNQENKKLGQEAVDYATHIILVGKKQTEPIREGVLSTPFPQDNLIIVDHVSEAIQWYQTNLKAGDAVLLLNDLPDTY